MTMLYPSVSYTAPSGDRRTFWLGAREALSIDLGEGAIAHALSNARDARGTDLRIEFWTGGDSRSCLLSLKVPR